MAIKVPFGIDLSGFKNGINDMRASVKGFGNKVEGDLLSGNRSFLKLGGTVGLVTAGVAALGGVMAAAFSKISEKVKRLDNQSGEAATGIEELQVLLQAAYRTGAENEHLIAALKNVKTRAVDAANGAKQYQGALARLNIDYRKFVNLPGERKLEQVAKGFNGAEDEAQAYRDILTLLGEDAGPKLIKVLEELGDSGFDNLNAAMKESGQVIEKEVIGGIKDAQKAWDDLNNKVATKGVQYGGLIANLLGSGDEKDVQMARAVLVDTIISPFTNDGPTFTDDVIAANEEKRLAKARDAKNDKIFKAAERKRKGEPVSERLIADQFKKDKNIDSLFGKYIPPEKQDKVKFKGVPVSSLQAIGGGGGVGGISTQISLQREANGFLKQIAEGVMKDPGTTGSANGGLK